MGNMIPRAGRISAGPGCRQFFWGNPAPVDASSGTSWRAYKMAQVRFQLMNFADERLMVGAQGRWQDLTDMNYLARRA
jgi:hypothetical protein